MAERDSGKAHKSGSTGSKETAGDVASESNLREQDAFLDEALEESFPASDPIAPDHASPKSPSK